MPDVFCNRLTLSDFLFENALPYLTAIKVPYTYLCDDAVKMWLRAPNLELEGVCGIDIETYPIERYEGTPGTAILACKSKIRTIQFYDGKQVVILDFMAADGSYLLKDREILVKTVDLLKRGIWAAHNAQFEVNHFTKLCEAANSPCELKIYCTMQAYLLLLQADKYDWAQYDHSLKGTARRILGVNVDKEIDHHRWKNPGKLDLEQIKYCVLDAILPRLLLEVQSENLAELGMLDYFKMNRALINTLAHMQLFGTPIDAAKHAELVVEWKAELAKAEAETFELVNAGKELESFDQLWEILLPKVAGKRVDTIKLSASDFLGDGCGVITLQELKNLAAHFEQAMYSWAKPETALIPGTNFAIDEKEANQLRIAYQRAFKNIDDEYFVNPGSSKQLSEWFKQNVDQETLLEWPVSDKTEENLKKFFAIDNLDDLTNDQKAQVLSQPEYLLSMSAEAFEDLGHIEAIDPISRYKKYSKLVSTYGVGLQNFYTEVPWSAHPTVHTNYSCCFTETGRLSSSKPALQNPPRDKAFRAIFTARDERYCILDADFSQIELRSLAEESQDPVMLEVYRTGGDIHTQTTEAISGKTKEQCSEEEWGELRTCGKIINFACISYGGGAGAARKGARKMHIHKPLDHFQSFINGARERYHVLRQYQLDQAASCKEPLQVRIRGGKIAALWPEWAYTQSLNYPIQGAAAVIMSKTMIKLYRVYCDQRLDLDFQIKNVIHDSLILDVAVRCVDQVKEIVKECMEEAMLEVYPQASLVNLCGIKVGVNWGEAK